jgi:hypothetical protein
MRSLTASRGPPGFLGVPITSCPGTVQGRINSPPHYGLVPGCDSLSSVVSCPGYAMRWRPCRMPRALAAALCLLQLAGRPARTILVPISKQFVKHIARCARCRYGFTTCPPPPCPCGAGGSVERRCAAGPRTQPDGATATTQRPVSDDTTAARPPFDSSPAMWAFQAPMRRTSFWRVRRERRTQVPFLHERRGQAVPARTAHRRASLWRIAAHPQSDFYACEWHTGRDGLWIEAGCTPRERRGWKAGFSDPPGGASSVGGLPTGGRVPTLSTSTTWTCWQTEGRMLAACPKAGTEASLPVGFPATRGLVRQSLAKLLPCRVALPAARTWFSVQILPYSATTVALAGESLVMARHFASS